MKSLTMHTTSDIRIYISWAKLLLCKSLTLCQTI